MRSFSAFLISFLFLLPAAGLAGESRRPSFVIILADDLGYGDLSGYGNREFSTPHLDRLASEGLKFTDFHSSGPVCSPTRAGLLTGRYQQRASVSGVIYAGFTQNRHHGLQLSERTLAEFLHEAGYATGAFGKWHLGYLEKYNPIHQGFDTFRGYVSGNIDYQNHLDRMGVHDWWHGSRRVREKGYSTHLITRHALEFIEKNRERPFLAYVAHEAPHDPFQGPDDPAFREEGKVVPERRTAAHKKRAYREMVQELDRSVGQIVEKLRELDLEENTLVFFFSDNGATRTGSCGSLRGHKGQLWEGGHRVPAVAWWPGKIRAGTTSNDLAISLDLLPTLLELAGVEAPTGKAGLDGRSLTGVLDGKTLPEDRELFWQYGKQQAARRGPWKYVERVRGLPAAGLFHLGEDPGETRNRADEKPELLEELRSAWQAWSRDVREGATPQPTESPFSPRGG